jgi:hypothetical protein
MSEIKWISVMGVSYRQNIIKAAIKGKTLPTILTGEVVSEPDNKYDINAKKIMLNDCHVGYIPKELTSEITDGPCQLEISYWEFKNMYLVKYAS